jgi:hypothetical protein
MRLTKLMPRLRMIRAVSLRLALEHLDIYIWGYKVMTGLPTAFDVRLLRAQNTNEIFIVSRIDVN